MTLSARELISGLETMDYASEGWRGSQPRSPKRRNASRFARQQRKASLGINGRCRRKKIHKGAWPEMGVPLG